MATVTISHTAILNYKLFFTRCLICILFNFGIAMNCSHQNYALKVNEMKIDPEIYFEKSYMQTVLDPNSTQFTTERGTIYVYSHSREKLVRIFNDPEIGANYRNYNSNFISVMDNTELFFIDPNMDKEIIQETWLNAVNHFKIDSPEKYFNIPKTEEYKNYMNSQYRLNILKRVKIWKSANPLIRDNRINRAVQKDWWPFDFSNVHEHLGHKVIQFY